MLTNCKIFYTNALRQPNSYNACRRILSSGYISDIPELSVPYFVMTNTIMMLICAEFYLFTREIGESIVKKGLENE